MTGTRQNKSLFTAERMKASVNMTSCFGVIDFHRDININTAERINYRSKTIEIYFGIVINLYTRKVRNRINSSSCTTEGVCCIDFLVTVSRNIYLRIARNRDHCDLFFLRINTNQDHRVGSICVAKFARIITIFRFIRPNEQHIEWV